jgi:AcrR family transcriptional regulator
MGRQEDRSVSRAFNADGVAADPPAGLRERKKFKTRDALSRAALDLFSSRGYDATTVDDIAASIDVSKRTFFRYFDGKEEVLLSVMRDAADQLIAELERRPAGEDPLTALRKAGEHAIRESADRMPPHNGMPLYLAVIDLIESTPALLAANLRVLLDRQDVIVDILARREGVDPVTDPRPRLLVALYGAAALVANRAWHESEQTETQALLDSIDLHLDCIAPAVTGHWATPSTS